MVTRLLSQRRRRWRRSRAFPLPVRREDSGLSRSVSKRFILCTRSVYFAKMYTGRNRPQMNSTSLGYYFRSVAVKTVLSGALIVAAALVGASTATAQYFGRNKVQYEE